MIILHLFGYLRKELGYISAIKILQCYIDTGEEG